MAGKGGIRSTSFTKETAPRKAKGTQHTTTKVRKAIGVDNWQQLGEWMETHGLQKYIDNMAKMNPREYSIAYATLLEYVKPKLQRTTIAGDAEHPIIWHEVKNYGAKREADDCP